MDEFSLIHIFFLVLIVTGTIWLRVRFFPLWPAGEADLAEYQRSSVLMLDPAAQRSKVQASTAIPAANSDMPAPAVPLAA